MTKLTPGDIKQAEEQIDLKQMTRMAYRDLINQRLVKARVETAIEIYQHEYYRGQLEEALEKENKEKLPDKDKVKQYEDSITYHKRQESSKRNKMSEIGFLIKSEASQTRIVGILEETE